jgi:hypothetical protein
MVIEGVKNLKLVQRALISHMRECALRAMRADEKQTAEVWDPEIQEIKTMLAAIEFNLKQTKEEG